MTAYRVFIQTSVTTYIEEAVHCLSNIAMVTNTLCTLPVEVLYEEPYNLVLGDSIYAKVLASNYYGEGPVSAPGNGATIVLVPHPPTSLTNDGAITDATKVGFYWSDGASSGGRDILDFRIWYDQSLDEFIILEEAVTERTYTTTIQLI